MRLCSAGSWFHTLTSHFVYRTVSAQGENPILRLNGMTPKPARDRVRLTADGFDIIDLDAALTSDMQHQALTAAREYARSPSVAQGYTNVVHWIAQKRLGGVRSVRAVRQFLRGSAVSALAGPDPDSAEDDSTGPGTPMPSDAED